MKSLTKFLDCIRDGVAAFGGGLFLAVIAYSAVYSVLRILFYVWGAIEK